MITIENIYTPHETEKLLDRIDILLSQLEGLGESSAFVLKIDNGIVYTKTKLVEIIDLFNDTEDKITFIKLFKLTTNYEFDEVLEKLVEFKWPKRR